MQKYVLALAASLALAAPLVPAFAQTAAPAPPMHGPRGGGRMMKMAAELGLTDAQKAQMKPILMSSRQQMMALRADTTLTPAARLAKMKALRKSTNMQTMAILTPAQRVKLKAMRQEQRDAKAGA